MLSDEDKKTAMAWAKKEQPHLLENPEMVYLLWRKQAKQERVSVLGGMPGYSFLSRVRHRVTCNSIITVVEMVRKQKEWHRCQKCWKKDSNCKCDPSIRKFDVLQNVVYLVGDNTMTMQGERYLMNGDESALLAEGKTYWGKVRKEYSSWWNCDILLILEVEELDGKTAKSYIDFVDSFDTVYSGRMQTGAFLAWCTKAGIEPDDILERFGLSQSEEYVEREA